MPPARASSAFSMDRGTQWFPGSDPGSHRACKRRGRCKWVRHLEGFLEEVEVGAADQQGQAPSMGLGQPLLL